ncbi:MAG: hypothetical protein KME27_21815 [Lyngbya sp. HA4199-MV5]|jgi:transposase|nr:hypothetical protein [Lyngbya sp. HA4199-MV5]
MNLEEALQRIQELEAENQALRVRLAEIERHLGLNSQTSSKPPSSNGLKKGARRTQSLRGKSERQRGGQAVHQGDTLKQVSEPDEVIMHPVGAVCCGCGRELRAVPALPPLKRQVFELPALTLVVSEHQVEQKECPHCQQRVQGVFPAEVKAATQYGKRIQAVAAYLSHQHLIPEARVCEMLGDFSGAR